MASVNLHPETFMSELFGVERTPDPTRATQFDYMSMSHMKVNCFPIFTAPFSAKSRRWASCENCRLIIAWLQIGIFPQTKLCQSAADNPCPHPVLISASLHHSGFLFSFHRLYTFTICVFLTPEDDFFILESGNFWSCLLFVSLLLNTLQIGK